MAKSMPGVPLSTLAHHMDIEWLHEAYRRTRKDAAVTLPRFSGQFDYAAFA